MRKYLLIGGSVAAILLIAFLGGMRLGQAQMYDHLVFGNADNEVLVKVKYKDNNILVKRYRNDDMISIIDSGMGWDEGAWKARLDESLNRIPGLEDYRLEPSGLTLIKFDNVRWEGILQHVLNLLIGP